MNGQQGHSSLEQVAAGLRARRAAILPALTGARAAAALRSLARRWTERAASGWTPPPGSPFPWPMIRVSLAGLLPGLAAAEAWRARTASDERPFGPEIVALVLAGNTPLLAWPALAAATLAGSAVFVKMSRHETLWPRLFVESLAEADPDLAALIHLDAWPGEDPRTAELVRLPDAVIAYGGDAALAALRAATPADVPFFGYGHALSVGVALRAGVPNPPTPFPASFASAHREGGAYTSALASGVGGFPEGEKETLGAKHRERSSISSPFPVSASERSREGGRGVRYFARDVLMFDQGGCLSPHAIFIEGGAAEAAALAEGLAAVLPEETETLAIPPVTDVAVAAAVRQARDLALFVPGTRVLADAADLRWTVVLHAGERVLHPPTGHGIVHVVPVSNLAERFGSLLGAARGRLSSVGVAGDLEGRPEVRAAILAEGVSRICAAGEMQAPPLDWPNGGRDLLASLRHL